MNILLWWREIVIGVLVLCCLWLVNGKQKLEHELKETVFIHESLVKDANLKAANAVATFQRQRQLDAERYANEVTNLNDKYRVAMSDSNRVQQEITTYNARLHTVTREAVENYAKTGTTLYNECRKEYLELGYYTAKVDAELDSKTKGPK